MTDEPLRVVVVEDSLTIRMHIVEVLSAAPNIQVVGDAADGKSAIELCQQLRPSVITMDMMLPVMTGVAATEYIMAYCPTPILIVSASTNRGELFRTYDALAAGAVDVLEKPRGDESDQTWDDRLIQAVRMVARIRVITHPRARLAYGGRALTALRTRPPPEKAPPIVRAPEVVGIGTSTGGPGALLTILANLPAGFPLPILVVQHISEPFGSAMAEWLDAQLNLEVRYAKHGELLPPPSECRVLMAPPGRHLELQEGRLYLTHAPERHSCRPSVDVLFESLAREMPGKALGCLLTGMGRDGARGLLAMKQSGGVTLAQDETSSIVFGMPGEAVKLGAATHVLPLSSIAASLARWAGMHG